MFLGYEFYTNLQALSFTKWHHKLTMLEPRLFFLIGHAINLDGRGSNGNFKARFMGKKASEWKRNFMRRISMFSTPKDTPKAIKNPYRK